MKSKLQALFAAALALSSVAYAQPNYQFHQTWGSTDNDQVRNVHLTSEEKIIVTGTFLETVDFDPGPGTTELTAPGSGFDFSSYILKLSQTGEFEWVKGIIPTTSNGSVDIRQSIIDVQGNIYIVGAMEGDVEFDPVNQDTVYAVSSGHEVFISKYDSDGNFIWGKCLGAPQYPMGTTVDVDAQGNVYIGGLYSSSLEMTQIGGSTLTSNGDNDGFIVKMDANGNHLWSHTIGGVGSDRINILKNDPSGDILIGGSQSGNIDMDPGAGTFMSGNTVADTDAFLMKLNSAGDFQWSQSYNGTNEYDAISDIDFKSDNSIVCIGQFQGTVNMNPVMGPAPAVSNGSADIFILALDEDGTYDNHFTTGGTSSDQATRVHIDNNNNTFIVGSFYNTIDFDFSPATNSKTSSGLSDVFTVMYDNNWNYQWSQAIGSTDYDIGYDVITNNQGSVYTVGIARTTVEMDPSGGQSITSEGNYDIFLQVLGDCFNKYNEQTETACDSYELPGGDIASQTGIYSDTLQSVNGCDSIINTDLTINNIDASVSQNGNMLTANQAGANYQWIDCDNGNAPIPGATNQSYTATTAGNYAVIVTINNCSNTSSCIYVSTASLNTWSETVNIYPNPAKDKLNFDLPNDEETFVNIYDLHGKVVLKHSITGSKTLSVAHLNKGTYFVQVTNSILNINRRIIIQ